MKEPEISIIVPIFNSEKWLPRCIDSILSQSFADFELVLINDGSTDRSGEICDQYALKDSRIKVVHIENGGVSNARNTGIKLSRGKYLMFCDSDDYVEKDWCKNLYNAIFEKPHTLPISGARIVRRTGNSYKKENIVINYKGKINKNEYFRLQGSRSLLISVVWNSIYKKEIIKKYLISFNISIDKEEDLLFNMEYINHIDSFLIIPSADYNYISTSENSLSSRYFKDNLKYMQIRYNAWLEYHEKYQSNKEIKERFVTNIFYSFLSIAAKTFDKRNTDSLLKKLHYNNQIVNSKEFIECLELADLSKEDGRYIRLLKTKNYYLVWLVERLYLAKKYLTSTTRGKINN